MPGEELRQAKISAEVRTERAAGSRQCGAVCESAVGDGYISKGLLRPHGAAGLQVYKLYCVQCVLAANPAILRSQLLSQPDSLDLLLLVYGS